MKTAISHFVSAPENSYPRGGAGQEQGWFSVISDRAQAIRRLLTADPRPANAGNRSKARRALISCYPDSLKDG